MRIGKLELKNNQKSGPHYKLELHIPFYPSLDLFGKLAEQKNDKSPFLQFYHKGFQCGAAWKRQTDDGREYLSAQIESPALPDGELSFFIWKDEEGEAFASIPRKNQRNEKSSEIAPEDIPF